MPRSSSRTGGRTGSTRCGSTCCATATRGAEPMGAPGTAFLRSRHPVTSRRRTRRTSRTSDRILRLAADYGFVVILDPAETGGWLGTMVSNGIDKLRAYGQYLGRRYKDFPNIIWMHGNDYQAWGPKNDPYVTAVARGIRDVDPNHLQTVELNYLGQRVARRPGLGAAHRPQRVLHLRADVQAGAQGLQPEQFPAHVHGRGKLRVRTQPRRSGRHAATAEAAGVLVAPERSDRTTLRQPLHVAVPLPPTGRTPETASAAGRTSSTHPVRSRSRT